MYYPDIDSLENSREAIVQFGGLQDKELTDDGFFRETQFVDNDNFPYLTAKCSRYEHQNIFPDEDGFKKAMVVTMIKKGGKLNFLLKYESTTDETYTYVLYYYNFAKNCFVSEELTSGYANDDTKLISYGAYILIFTDQKIKYYFNTQVLESDTDYCGVAGNEVTLPSNVNSTGQVYFVLCDSDGKVYAEPGDNKAIKVQKSSPDTGNMYSITWTTGAEKSKYQWIYCKMTDINQVIRFQLPCDVNAGEKILIQCFRDKDEWNRIKITIKNQVYPLWSQLMDYDENISDHKNAMVLNNISVNTDALWLDSDSGTLKKYSDSYGMWTPITTTYIKVYADVSKTQYDWIDKFSIGDKIKIYGVAFWDITCGTEKEKSFTIYNKGYDDDNRPFIVIDNVFKTDYYIVQSFYYGHDINGTTYTKPNGFDGVKIVRDIPQMDFITVSNNRVWGCYKGISNYHKVESIDYYAWRDSDGVVKRIMKGYGIWNKSKNVNEIYASALGNFKNWYNYGTTANSGYALSLGDDGEFTGACTYQGYPMFFKENNVYKIYGSYPAQYQLQTFDFRGVEKGADKTLATVGGYLIYKTPKDFVIFDGSSITSISKDIKFEKGGKEYATKVQFMPYNATGYGDNKYYCTAVHKGYDDDIPHWYVFIYDIEKGFWIKQKNAYFVSVVSDNSGALYYAPVGDGEQGPVVCREGEYDKALDDKSGIVGNIVENHDFEWFVETGYQGFEYPDHKYIQRINIRAKVPLNKTLKVKISYDGREFEEVGRISGNGKPTVTTIRIIPKRCDYYAMRLEGDGDTILYGIYRTLKQGSDIK